MSTERINTKDTSWSSEPYARGRSLLRLRSDEKFVREIEKEAALLGMNVSSYVKMGLRHYMAECRAIRERSRGKGEMSENAMSVRIGEAEEITQ